MKFHKEGYPTLFVGLLFSALLVFVAENYLKEIAIARYLIWAVCIFLMVIIIQFFRSPNRMIEAAYVRTKEILSKHKDQLKTLAELLLEKEVIFKDDLEKIFGKRAFNDISRSDELLAANAEVKSKNGVSKTTKPKTTVKAKPKTVKKDEETKADTKNKAKKEKVDSSKDKS